MCTIKSKGIINISFMKVVISGEQDAIRAIYF